MDATVNQINERKFCTACYTQVDQEDQFCNSCGYPLKGTEQEQERFMSVRNVKEIDLVEANIKIKRASYALYFIAGATVLMGLIMYGSSKTVEVKNDLLLINIILAAIYAGLGLWCRSKPLAAIISGASLYALVLILNAIVSPLTIVSGIIFKIFIIGYFIRGIKSAVEAEKLKKELNIG